MKVEFEINDRFTDYPDPKFKMESILSAFAKMLLVTLDETIYDVKIDGEDVAVY
jgi:hypothetical protein